jgi:translation initiation factor 3 subunit L
LDEDEEKVLQEMMVLKQNSRTVKWSEGPLLEGKRVVNNNLDFVIDNVRSPWKIDQPCASLGVRC